MGVGHAASTVLAGIGGAVARWDTLVGVPLVDAHQAFPARVALAQVGTPAADLDRRAGLGQRDEAVLSCEWQVLSIVFHIGQAAIETCRRIRGKPVEITGNSSKQLRTKRWPGGK